MIFKDDLNETISSKRNGTRIQEDDKESRSSIAVF